MKSTTPRYRASTGCGFEKGIPLASNRMGEMSVGGWRNSDASRNGSDLRAELMQELASVLRHEALSEFRKLDHQATNHSQRLRAAADQARLIRDRGELLSVDVHADRMAETSKEAGEALELTEAATDLGKRLGQEASWFEASLDQDSEVKRIVRDALRAAIRLLEVRSMRGAQSCPGGCPSPARAGVSGVEALSDAILGMRQRFIRALRALEGGGARPWQDCAPLLRASAWESY